LINNEHPDHSGGLSCYVNNCVCELLLPFFNSAISSSNSRIRFLYLFWARKSERPYRSIEIPTKIKR